jgi:hypothetical protein
MGMVFLSAKSAVATLSQEARRVSQPTVIDEK